MYFCEKKLKHKNNILDQVNSIKIKTIPQKLNVGKQSVHTLLINILQSSNIHLCIAFKTLACTLPCVLIIRLPLNLWLKNIVPKY